MQEDKFEEEKEDDEDYEEKQQELDRGKISTREIKRRGQLDVSDQATELDVQTVPQVEILDTTGNFMVGDGQDSDEDDNIERQEG